MLQYLLAQLRLVPALMETLEDFFPWLSRWMFGYFEVFDGITSMQCSSLRYAPQFQSTLNTLFDEVYVMQPKRPKNSQGKSRMVLIETTTNKKKKRTQPEPDYSTMPKVIECPAHPLENMYAMVEEFCKDMAHGREIVFKRAYHQVFFCLYIMALFSEPNKRPRKLKVVMPGEFDKPAPNVDIFVGAETVARLDQITKTHDLKYWFNHLELMKEGLSREQCDYIRRMEEESSMERTPGKMLQAFFRWPKREKFLVYAWLNLIFQAYYLQFIKRGDAWTEARQLEALARASGRSPNMLSETNSLIIMSTTSGRLKSGTINAVGPKQVVWDGLTRKFKDKQPRSKFLKKRRHFVERPLVTK